MNLSILSLCSNIGPQGPPPSISYGQFPSHHQLFNHGATRVVGRMRSNTPNYSAKQGPNHATNQHSVTVQQQVVGDDHHFRSTTTHRVTHQTGATACEAPQVLTCKLHRSQLSPGL